MNEKDLKILAHFRRNARKNLTKISKETNIPVSTIFEKLKKFEGDIIKKHTSLINFKKMGYNVRTFLVLRANKEVREDLKNFLVKHCKVNSVFKVNGGYDFLADVVFKDMAELCRFSDELSEFNLLEMKEYFILDEIKEEAFLTE